MYGTNDCIAYINKLRSFSSGTLIISASSGGYNNSVYCLDDGSDEFAPFSYAAIQALTNDGVSPSNIYYGPQDTNVVIITNATNVAGFWSWGTHGHLNYLFPLNGAMTFSGSSSWYIMTTGESYNGWRYSAPSPQYQSSFLMWFSANAFGGTNYLNTPVGAASITDEPFLSGQTDPAIFYSLWSQGKTFAICAWNAARTDHFQAVGDPFVKK